MHFRINQNYRFREIAGKFYLLPVGEAADVCDQPVELTETAACIWNSLAKGASAEEAAEALTEEFEVDLGTALTGVRRFMEVLAQQGAGEITNRGISL